MINIYSELNKFSNVVFDDLFHSYHIGNHKLDSATGLIKTLHHEFESNYWSVYKALQQNGFNVKSHKKEENCIFFVDTNKSIHINEIDNNFFSTITPQNILDSWKNKSEISTYLGSCVHDYVEMFYAKKSYRPPLENYNGTIKFDEIRERYKKSVDNFHKFYEKTKDILIPIYSEFVIGELKSLMGGMIDQLFWNLRTNNLQVWDWKTNEKINTENKFQKLFAPFDLFDDCELVKYSVQLNTYKTIIERNTNLKLGSCYIVHLGSDLDTYKVYSCYDFSEQIDQILNNRILKFKIKV